MVRFMNTYNLVMIFLLGIVGIISVFNYSNFMKYSEGYYNPYKSAWYDDCQENDIYYLCTVEEVNHSGYSAQYRCEINTNDFCDLAKVLEDNDLHMVYYSYDKEPSNFLKGFPYYMGVDE